MQRKKIAVIMGTRPEAIKMAPVVRALERRCDDVETTVITTAQHRQMLDQVLSIFDIRPDIDLDLMQPNQSLSDLTGRVMKVMEEMLGRIQPDLLLVQGDTTTAFAAALAAFYRRIPVGHVEAGLRSHDLYNPFPEEANRRLVTQLTEVHLAPTPLARMNLLDEGVPVDRIAVTGNTVIDALHMALDKPYSIQGTPLQAIPLDGQRVILVTCHRRESWNENLSNICLALKGLAERFTDIQIVYPVHLNPNVLGTVNAMLSGIDRIHLIAPLDYVNFVNLMSRSHLVLTDSGGVTEEAPSHGKPALVLRDVIDRPEACEMGLCKLVGTTQEGILEEASRLLTNPEAYTAMTGGQNPYGDGRAADRVADAVCRWLAHEKPLLRSDEQFGWPARRVMLRAV